MRNRVGKDRMGWDGDGTGGVKWVWRGGWDVVGGWGGVGGEVAMR